jgi:hypothetical protein
MSELDEQQLHARLARAAGEVDGLGDPTSTWQRASRRVGQRRRRRRAASAAVVVLVLGLGAAATLPRLLGPAAPESPGVAGVEAPPASDAGGSDAGGGPSSDTQPRTGGGEPGDSEPGDTEVATATCRNGERGFAVDYPTRWESNGSTCSQFGPDPDRAPQGAGVGGRKGVRVYATVYDVSFDVERQRILGNQEVAEVVASQRRSVDGRRALRWESVATAQSPAPQGRRLTGWLVELSANRALILTTDDLEQGSYRENVEALDLMATSVRPLDDR